MPTIHRTANSVWNTPVIAIDSVRVKNAATGYPAMTIVAEQVSGLAEHALRVVGVAR